MKVECLRSYAVMKLKVKLDKLGSNQFYLSTLSRNKNCSLFDRISPFTRTLVAKNDFKYRLRSEDASFIICLTSVDK